MVNLLIKHEASVNISDEKQNSPLHWAAQSGSRKSVELLLAARANPNRINSQVIIDHQTTINSYQ